MSDPVRKLSTIVNRVKSARSIIRKNIKIECDQDFEFGNHFNLIFFFN
jgi:hypothetical protein